jgi:hypothetical protein
VARTECYAFGRVDRRRAKVARFDPHLVVWVGCVLVCEVGRGEVVRSGAGKILVGLVCQDFAANQTSA